MKTKMLVLGALAALAMSTTAFAQALDLGHGISGYAYHTVIMAIYAWFHHRNDFHGTIESIIACGGDTDTTAAIAGALAPSLALSVAAAAGAAAVPMVKPSVLIFLSFFVVFSCDFAGFFCNLSTIATTSILLVCLPINSSLLIIASKVSSCDRSACNTCHTTA